MEAVAVDSRPKARCVGCNVLITREYGSWILRVARVRWLLCGFCGDAVASGQRQES